MQVEKSATKIRILLGSKDNYDETAIKNVKAFQLDESKVPYPFEGLLKGGAAAKIQSEPVLLFRVKNSTSKDSPLEQYQCQLGYIWENDCGDYAKKMLTHVKNGTKPTSTRTPITVWMVKTGTQKHIQIGDLKNDTDLFTPSRFAKKTKRYKPTKSKFPVYKIGGKAGKKVVYTLTEDLPWEVSLEEKLYPTLTGEAKLQFEQDPVSFDADTLNHLKVQLKEGGPPLLVNDELIAKIDKENAKQKAEKAKKKAAKRAAKIAAKGKVVAVSNLQWFDPIYPPNQKPAGGKEQKAIDLFEGKYNRELTKFLQNSADFGKRLTYIKIRPCLKTGKTSTLTLTPDSTYNPTQLQNADVKKEAQDFLQCFSDRIFANVLFGQDQIQMKKLGKNIILSATQVARLRITLLACKDISLWAREKIKAEVNSTKDTISQIFYKHWSNIDSWLKSKPKEFIQLIIQCVRNIEWKQSGRKLPEKTQWYDVVTTHPEKPVFQVFMIHHHQ